MFQKMKTPAPVIQKPRAIAADARGAWESATTGRLVNGDVRREHPASTLHLE